MISTGIDQRVQIQNLIENQLPEFILSESPKALDFFKQYYVSQEFPGGPVDIAENLDQYIKVDNLTPEVIKGSTQLSYDINNNVGVITVTSTKGFPNKYGLLKIDDEIISYTGVTTNTFTGCIRGFSGITNYHKEDEPDELVFSTSSSSDHLKNSVVENLSSLFLKEFYKKLKVFLTPGLEDVEFIENLDVNNFIKNARSFYQAKGTSESFKILFNILYGETPKVIDLEQYLLKPSASKFIRREVLIAERISGNPLELSGQTIFNSKNPSISGSVSEVEILVRQSKLYYKISLFIGFDEIDKNQVNQFNIPGKTKVLESVDPGEEIISVDSTIGFEKSGTLISGSNVITYTSTSVNQFFGCSGIEEKINVADDIRSDEVIYGYEGGDLNKKVELRITGIIADFVPKNDILLLDEGELISVKNIGEIIKNPSLKQLPATSKEIFANSWIYNTSCRYEIASKSAAILTLRSEIEPSSLKPGDSIEILERNSETVLPTGNLTVGFIDILNKEISVNGVFDLQQGVDYDLRRIIKKSSIDNLNVKEVELEYGNNKIISDVQNLYVDNSYAYVASNSLPDYPLEIDVTNALVEFLDPGSYDEVTQSYSIFVFNSNVPFITGDIVTYECDNDEILGLTDGETYYVQVLDPKNRIRLYTSKTFIGSEEYVLVREIPNNSGNHRFILNRHRSKKISAQKILRKFPLDHSYAEEYPEKVQPGGIGLLINGVEIISPKSKEKIYYGPLENIIIANGGSDYDVINPPELKISPSPTGGTDALANFVVSGSVQKVLVDPQNFDISDVISVTISGGNGSGAVFEPIISKRFREIEFDSALIQIGGGIDNSDETITFETQHNLQNYEKIVYSSNGNTELGISTYFGENKLPTGYLVNGGSYYARLVNSSTIKLYNSFKDAYSGINTIGFTTSNTIGIHKFRTEAKNTLSDIKVINSGSGYQNRKLRVKTSGISTTNHTVTFNSHNFNDGDLIEYNSTGSPISGLSTTSSYYVLKLDENNFRLAYAGIGTNLTRSNYERKNYELFNSKGSGYHVFKYPDIELTVNVSFGSSLVGVITATPVLRGSIVDSYLYETGTGYGSTVLDLHKKPLLTIENGKNGEVKPIIINGKIVKVEVTSLGNGYSSAPDLIVSGDGSGAIIKSVVSGGKLVNAIVIKSGAGYSKEKTTIKVSPPGKNAKLDCSVRSLTINENFRANTEILVETSNNLQYSCVGYPILLGRLYFGDVTPPLPPLKPAHSPIIGWAYDGNPIYGPYGYEDPSNIESNARLLVSSYVLDSSNVFDRPSTFDDGFFVEDYKFNNSGDLDSYNGRFCKTQEFPNGVYAYFATVDIDNNPQYPYFVGEKYRSPYVKDNLTLDQTFDFNNSNLSRNTFPYKIGDLYAKNDFLIEPNKVIDQLSTIQSVSKGSINSFTILSPGQDYKVGDVVKFNDEGTNGGGLSATVSDIEGKDIVKVETNVESYSDVVFTWKDENTIVGNILPTHELLDGNNINISGLSTSISKLPGSHNIGVSSETISLFSNLASNSNNVTDIYVSNIKNSISIGSSLQIENEIVKVLDIFENLSVLRIKRYNVGSSHTISTPVLILPNTFNLNLKTKYFNSKVDDLVYFNPKQTVGVGTTTGISVGVAYTVGGISTDISVPVQSIYLPNHPFKTGQSVTFSRGTSGSLLVKQTPSGASFNLPSNTEQEVYIINKSKDYIGITTLVGLTTNTNGLYFISNGSDFYEYSLQSNYDQVIGLVERIESTVSISTSHELSNGDFVKLTITPNLSLGIGNSDFVKVKYNPSYDKILVDPIGFTSSAINTTTNVITINSHGFKTGDKVFYDSYDLIASGLQTGGYFVYKVDDDRFKLSKTYLDTQLRYPNTIDIIGIGGTSHELSLVNPQISPTKNNNLVFDLSHASLNGYQFNIFYDENFDIEFLSSRESSDFNVSIGSSEAIIYYSEKTPTKLYYTLTKSGQKVGTDYDVKNYSQIYYTDSKYNGNYKVYGIGSTSFNISLKNIPEKLSYVESECNTFKYTTSSKNAKGGVSDLKIISKGLNYKKIPTFVKIESEQGENALILPNSNDIGKIKKTRILEQGFEYSSDKTLRPEAFISPTFTITDFSTISSVEIVYGGKNYISPPKLIIIDSETREIVNDDALTCETYSGSVSNVIVNVQPYGLKSTKYEVIALDNSNGTYISTVSSDSNSIRCFLSPPLAGFTTNVFNVGDEVFLENIQKIGSDGTGFNSEDYGYEFFTVTEYFFDPPQVVLSLSGKTTNPGTASTVQSNYPIIVSRNNYPRFNVIQEVTSNSFIVGEQLLIKEAGIWVKKDLYISIAKTNYIKVSGSYDLSVDQTIKGSKSGVICTVQSITKNEGKFNVSYSILQEYGWLSDTGKLSEDYQVLPDNDYYQNLSYSIKSTIEFEKSIDSVNRLVHTSGLKNFSDTEIKSSSRTGIGSTGSDVIVLDIIGENNVYTINNLDFATDVDIVSANKTKSIKLKNKKLASYIDCISNRVLSIDDISDQFLSRGTNTSESGTQYIKLLPLVNNFGRYLIQVINPNTTHRQLTELIILDDDTNAYTLEKETITNSQEVLANLEGEIDEFGQKYLKVTPKDIFDTDLDIKVFADTFNTNLAGIGTASVGFIDLIGSNTIVSSGTTSTLYEYDKDKIESIYLSVQVIDESKNISQYTELYVEHDDSDAYFTEYYFDSKESTYSSIRSGEFEPKIVSNKLKIDFYNSSNSNLLIRAKSVGFGTTSVGSSVYRFKFAGQIDGTERSARLEANYVSSGVSTNIVTVDYETVASVKSLVRVSYGNTSALHQVAMIVDEDDSNTVQYPFLSIGSTTGIGTFGGEFIGGTQVVLRFYPDEEIVDDINIQSYNEVLYTENDSVNDYPRKLFGSITESILLGRFDAFNGSRVNRLNFNINYQGFPVYLKTFNPVNSSTLDTETGIFTIPNHFFSDTEKLVYTPTSTFIGIAASALGIGQTLNSSGILTSLLPSDVYVVKINDDQFKLSTRRDYAQSGIAVTFTSFGSGNAHTLEMVKKLEKTVVALDGVIQKPISFVPISYSLKSNVGASVTYFGISGISTIKPRDLLKVDDEIVRIVSVGVGTTSSGPIISGGNVPIVNVERGFVGTAITSHTIGSNISLYRGSYNIVGNKICFTEPPTGSGDLLDRSTNLSFPKSSFSGRVYLRDDYTTNQIYDDISYQFTGIGQTYTLTVQGVNTTGISTGDGILFINNVFQTPTTDNNLNNDYSLITSSGISSVVFSGISTLATSPAVRSETDVNQNFLPRGGIIVSLGSTPGLGFAPLVGAQLRAIVGAGGSIASVTGTSYTGTGKNVSTAYYNNSTGIVEITTATAHGLESENFIKLVGLAFTCPSSSGIVSYFPLSNLSYSYPISGIVSARTFRAFVGYSTLPHTYIGMGTVFPWYNLNYGSGYYGTVSIGITDYSGSGSGAVISASIGAGGSLTSVKVVSGGSGYSNPYVKVPQPSYSNLPVIGVSRFGIGATTKTGENLLVTLDVGSSSTTGIGSTLFEVKTFKIARPGYGFKIGDVFKPVGLVTAAGLSSPLADFELTVVDTFEDSFYAWQFGEFDYIDSVKFLQNGARTRFPLYYNGTLRSFEKNPSSPIELDSVLLIFVNGVLQKPGDSYLFDGGTSFIFNNPPKPEDKITIFFYRGTKGVDSKEQTVYETIKNGDTVQLLKGVENSEIPINIFNPSISNISVFISAGSTIITNIGIDTTSLKVGQIIEPIISVIPQNTSIISIEQDSIIINKTSLNAVDLNININVGSISTAYESATEIQEKRTIANLVSSDIFDTNIYTGIGITDLYYRPFNWTKQKVDKIINGEYVYKSRDVLESRIYPTARIIRTVFPNDKQIFVDDARFFDYEIGKYGLPALNINSFDVLLIDNNEPVAAAITATVSIAGTISALTVTNPGSGYTGSSLEVKIGIPTSLSPGIGTQAKAIVSIVGGGVSTSPANITNPGFGYTIAPKVLAPLPKYNKELIKNVTIVEGFSGIVTGITTVAGIGTNLALKFFLNSYAPHTTDSTRDPASPSSGNFVGLTTGYPIYIYDTNIGSGVTSIDRNNSQRVGIGTTFLDNVYHIHAGTSLNTNDTNAEIICNVHSNSPIIGLSTYSTTNSNGEIVGRFSWGKLSGFTRSSTNPVSIGISGYTDYIGLSTFPTIQRRDYGFRDTGGVGKISENPND